MAKEKKSAFEGGDSLFNRIYFQSLVSKQVMAEKV